MLSCRIEKHVLTFKTPGGTSRGVLTEKKLWLYHVINGEKTGVGECSVIPGLTPEYENDEQYEGLIQKLLGDPNYVKEEELHRYSSIRFGWETALRDLETGGKQQLFDNAFSRGETGIPINGLIWMGDPEFMQKQIDHKLEEGFSCLKMKVGAIAFDTELEILKGIRKRYSSNELVLRVDANGAFSVEDAREKLHRLARLDIHSIEQPIASGQHEPMRKLCAEEILPIALDEELIGVYSDKDQTALLDFIRPQYIILKPGLHGGIGGTQDWISLAEQRNIPWWITSALESNIGLNAIAQLTGEYDLNGLHQGLGTGGLYTTNFPSRLFIAGGELHSKS